MVCYIVVLLEIHTKGCQKFSGDVRLGGLGVKVGGGRVGMLNA